MNRTKGGIAALVLGSAGLLSGAAHADIVWHEGNNGDLSNAQGAPTQLVLAPGSNLILAAAGTGDTQDWVVVTIPSGFQLSALVNTRYTANDPQGFMGMQAGASFVGSPFAAGSYAGFAHFGSAAVNGGLPAINTVGANMLPLMANPAVAPGSTGMSAVLGPGTYTFLFQQLSGATAYEFDFVLTPAPSGAALIGLAAAGWMRRSRR